MKWFIVALMFNGEPNQVGTDIYAYTAYPFADEILCRAFLKKNRELSVKIASLQWDGRPVEKILCVNEVELASWIDGKESI